MSEWNREQHYTILEICAAVVWLQLCSAHLKKYIIEIEKIWKMVRICFQMMSDCESMISLSLEKRWLEVYETMSVTEMVNTGQFALSSKRWSKSCLTDVPVAGSKLSNESGSSCDGDVKLYSDVRNNLPYFFYLYLLCNFGHYIKD